MGGGVVDSALSIAVTSFLVGLSGAMMPGPVLTVTIGETAARLRSTAASRLIRGAAVGPLIVVGHGILEVCLVLAIVLGIGALLTRTPIMGTIGIAGGLTLIWMAWGMFRGLKGLTLATEAGPAVRRRHPVWAGILTSVSNPYWILWWATVGLGFVTRALEYGPLVVVGFYLSHFLADLGWLSAVGSAVTAGRRVLTPAIYRGIFVVCGVFLLGLGVYFLYSGAQSLASL